MFYLSHSFVVRPPLLQFIAAVALGQGVAAVAGRKRVENPNIKKCALPVLSPQAFCNDVQAGATLLVCCLVLELLLCHWL